MTDKKTFQARKKYLEEKEQRAHVNENDITTETIWSVLRKRFTGR